MSPSPQLLDDAGTSNIVFASDIVANVPDGDGVIHDDESFLVQWSVQNAGCRRARASPISW